MYQRRDGGNPWIVGLRQPFEPIPCRPIDMPMVWCASLGCLPFFYPKAFEIKRGTPRLKNRQETEKLLPILQIRLSLSPRQKIQHLFAVGLLVVIARVPYKEAELLVHDEATTDHFFVITRIIAALKKRRQVYILNFLIHQTFISR